jgi:glycosyltransferase involved in cell wall biosynthesis
MLRAIVMSHASPHYSKGGGELAAYREHTFLRQNGVDSLFTGAMHADSSSYSPTIEATGPNEILVRVKNYDNRYEIWNDGRGMVEFVDYVARREPDVVHIHHYWRVGLNTIVALRRRLPAARFVLTFHEMLAICLQFGQMVKSSGELCWRYDRVDCQRCSPDRTLNEVERRRLAYLSVFRLMDFYVYPSQFIRGRYETWGLDPDKGIVLENILRLDEVPLDERGTEDLEIADTPRKFAFFGAPTRFKGLDVLIRATGVARKHSSDFVVHLYGATRKATEEMFPDLAETIEKLGDTLCFMGTYEPASVYGLMRRCEWMVIPSIWWENSPVVIQEALAAGLPMIVGNAGGMAEKVRDGVDGIHFQIRDHLDLADKIARVATRALSTKLKKSMAKTITGPQFLRGLEQAFGQRFGDFNSQGD